MIDLSHPYVIAEAGTCHAAPQRRQRYARALEYIEAARHAGADACKFQMFATPLSDVFCPIEGDEARHERWRQTALPLPDWQIIKYAADELGIDLLFSVFQRRTVRWLKELDVKATKVASRAAKNFPYEDATGDIIVSNGMWKGVIQVSGRRVHVMQCESKYPSDIPWEGVLPGYSCHSPTPDLAIDAIKRGCKLVEVHFYIDPSHAGRDLPASLTLDGLRKVCEAAHA